MHDVLNAFSHMFFQTTNLWTITIVVLPKKFLHVIHNLTSTFVCGHNHWNNKANHQQAYLLTTTFDMEAYNNENTYGENDQFFEKPSRLIFSYCFAI